MSRRKRRRRDDECVMLIARAWSRAMSCAVRFQVGSAAELLLLRCTLDSLRSQFSENSLARSVQGDVESRTSSVGKRSR